MLDLISTLLTGGNGLFVALSAVLAAIGAAYLKGRSAEKIKQKAKNADALQKHYDDIADATDARNGVDTSRLPDRDPYRRD